MRKMILLLAVILLMAAGSRAQDTPAAEVSASYSYLRLGVRNGVNQNGGSVSIAGNFNHWLGIAADVGGYHAAPFGVGLNTLTYMGGPRFSYRSSGRVTPFAQVLLGGARTSASAFGTSASTNGFAFSAGGGVDLRFTKHIALRPQLDYIGMRVGSSTLNTVRGSFGVVFRFGNR
jgi:outer membrane immunogenic protein